MNDTNMDEKLVKEYPHLFLPMNTKKPFEDFKLAIKLAFDLNDALLNDLDNSDQIYMCDVVPNNKCNYFQHIKISEENCSIVARILHFLFCETMYGYENVGWNRNKKEKSNLYGWQRQMKEKYQNAKNYLGRLKNMIWCSEDRYVDFFEQNIQSVFDNIDNIKEQQAFDMNIDL